jgi:hypothetical protein
VFGVALPAQQLMAGGGDLRRRPGVDVGQRVVALNGRFAASEQVQVRAVQ